MPDLKRTFAKAKMNKDIDERILPNGEYRHALNVQVSTSDNGDIGSLRNIRGNTRLSNVVNSGTYGSSSSKCVGIVENSATDKIYYFLPSPSAIKRDCIIEYNTATDKLAYVFVDIYEVTTSAFATPATTQISVQIGGGNSVNTSGIRVGMSVVSTAAGITEDDNIKVIAISYVSYKWRITTNSVHNISPSDDVSFKARRVLELPSSGLMTGINILDDTLFWTDNLNEPKKIDITKSIKGTGGLGFMPSIETMIGDNYNSHTRFIRSPQDNNDLSLVSSDNVYPKYVKHEDVTVIRKSPNQALNVGLSSTAEVRSGSTTGFVNNVIIYNQTHPVGENITGTTFTQPVDFRHNDIVLWSAISGSNTGAGDYDIRTRVTWSASSASNSVLTGVNFEVLSISADLLNLYNNWELKLERQDEFLESKFVRFSYRYKYQSGEYSTFAPWSKIAFIPGYYNYYAQEGYNKGMVNNLRDLKLRNYIPTDMPLGVYEIDILYKETNNPTVYTVKTLKRSNEDSTWPIVTTDEEVFELKSDIIHAVVPSNQLLRPWDNVPRKALAQEVSANRIIYGNYLQDYTVSQDPVIDVSIEATSIPSNSKGQPSVKSLRKYQVGVVFSDEYGRETPVITSEAAFQKIQIANSYTANKLNVNIQNSSFIPNWATHYSFYIKEPSVEYYTLAMDRWYNASDGNIWLSFPSSERNKISDDTFLYLKKGHGNNVPGYSNYKYKVLAVENEAPEYIKTIYTKLGGIAGSIGTSSGGYPLVGASLVSVPTSSILSLAEVINVNMTTDSFRLRFKNTEGGFEKSKYYNVNKVTNNDTRTFFHLHGVLGNDVSWSSSDNTYSGRIDTLEITIHHGEAKSRPEFDGRFFVKIIKNLDVTNYVTSHQGDDWIVHDSQEIKYINNNCYNTTDPNYTEPVVRTDFSAANFQAHPTEHADHSPTYNWTTSSTTLPGSFDITTNPVEELNGEDASSFWTALHGSFFIDRCSAYSWNGRQNNLPGSPYGEGNGGSGGYWTLLEGGEAGDHLTSNDLFNSELAITTYMTNGQNYKTLPSRGIWNSNGSGYMDLSWTGFTNEQSEASLGFFGAVPNPTGSLAQNAHLSYDSERQTEAEFIKDLCRPNAKFRFANDPDSTVYTTKIYMQLFNPPSNGDNFTNDVSSLDSDSNFSSYDSENNLYSEGLWGIRNYWTSEDENQFDRNNLRQRWTVKVIPEFGSGASGYNPTTGTINNTAGVTPVRALHHDGSNSDAIQILTPSSVDDDGNDISGGFVTSPAAWETEPSKSVDIDIYYQASDIVPLYINDTSGEDFAPTGSTFAYSVISGTVTGWDKNKMLITPALSANITGSTVTLTTPSGRITKAVFSGTSGDAYITVNTTGTGIAYSQHTLPWSNCWSFGNGVESDRIRDDYNAPQVDNGVKASTVLDKQLKEERRKNGIIWSGIYNSNSGVNNTNQFIAAEKITKDINPSHGSIQRLLARDNDLIILCEDKILRAVTNKDALYNADGNPQLISSNTVIGNTVAYNGDWGISKNPESLAKSASAVYFSDATRGSVISLTTKGLIPISSIGMEKYFSGLKAIAGVTGLIIGSFDTSKQEYNITISGNMPKTLSFSERSKSWVSFKSFIQEAGISLNNNYYTFKTGFLWLHNSNVLHNNFYLDQYTSSVTTIFSDSAGGVKSFNTISYEGSKARVTPFVSTEANMLTGNYGINYGLNTATVYDGEYFNLVAETGWYMDSLKTDLQDAAETEFKNKEGKWFGVPKGKQKDNNAPIPSTAELSTQGIGRATIAYTGVGDGTVTVTAKNQVGAPWD